jgi:hypothetical protein
MLGESISRIGQGADSCALELALALPLMGFDAQGPERQFWHKSSSLMLGDIAVAAGMGGPFRFSVGEQERATLMVSGGAGAEVRLGGSCYRNHGGQPLLYLPGEAYDCAFADPHGLALSLPTRRLAASALAMAQSCGLEGLDLGVLQRPHLFDTHGRSGRVAALLRRSFALVDRGLATQQLAGIIPSLERMVTQQLCGLLYPQLLEAHPGRFSAGSHPPE